MADYDETGPGGERYGEAEDVHAGWLLPGEVLCVGTGPVHLRYSREEAWQLYKRLGRLLNWRMDRPVGRNYELCGCDDGDAYGSPTQADVDAGEVQRAMQRAMQRARRAFIDGDWGHVGEWGVMPEPSEPVSIAGQFRIQPHRGGNDPRTGATLSDDGEREV